METINTGAVGLPVLAEDIIPTVFAIAHAFHKVHASSNPDVIREVHVKMDIWTERMETITGGAVGLIVLVVNI